MDWSIYLAITLGIPSGLILAAFALIIMGKFDW
jgi:hypothetical protein